ncbi:BrxA/BrxB family bacilliredoxin [Sporosarcina sp. PTS2304]|uniref:BrxA/BrxB family bacilliredoxin n=1 Tax=Sporosarcina sp. PTS2304 TaxID=2283194 RepID=UPI000E0D7701|nr:BrxA/BrxB family bacilliredoxin [Sporosarcina sp. PTS2304]AXI01291.1 BrxA/BrxB family bacilliredoxin [Sporosarcina sp. PTS2304]
MNAYDEYMRGIITPMREELTNAGFTELTTAESVDETLKNLKGSALIVINSVCGCAAGLARPAVREAVAEVKPDHLLTVFAGQDKEATEALRAHFPEIPPSSPSVAIWDNGKLVYFVPREQIENFQKEQIKDHLVDVLTNVVGQ